MKGFIYYSIVIPLFPGIFYNRNLILWLEFFSTVAYVAIYLLYINKYYFGAILHLTYIISLARHLHILFHWISQTAVNGKYYLYFREENCAWENIKARDLQERIQIVLGPRSTCCQSQWSLHCVRLNCRFMLYSPLWILIASLSYRVSQTSFILMLYLLVWQKQKIHLKLLNWVINYIDNIRQILVDSSRNFTCAHSWGTMVTITQIKIPSISSPPMLLWCSFPVKPPHLPATCTILSSA